MTNTEKRDQFWNEYQALLENPKAYGIDKVSLEIKIEDLNDAIRAEGGMTDLNEAVYMTFGRIYGALTSSRSAEEQLALIRREVYATWAVMFPESAETPVADEVSA